MAKPVLIIPRQKPRKGWACLTCGAWFAKDEHSKFERHSVACAERNVHIEQDLSPRARLGIFGGVPVDGELERWVKRHRRALLEDRLKL